MKNVIAVAVFLITVVLVFLGLHFFGKGNTEVVTTEKRTVITEIQRTTENRTTEKKEETTTKKPPETTTQKERPTERPTERPAERPHSGEVINKGKTSKGFDITEIDGITYVDGVMIANKTYPLPRDYNPGELTDECARAFGVMQKAAAESGLNIYVASGFRSYDLQNRIYNRYVGRDGKAAADRYSARPGHSEHQTGLAIDLNTISSSFAGTPEGKWIEAHSWEYGFILRYKKETESKTGYMYEPWHIRYVGKKAAAEIYASGLCVEEYYGITSEYQ